MEEEKKVKRILLRVPADLAAEFEAFGVPGHVSRNAAILSAMQEAIAKRKADPAWRRTVRAFKEARAKLRGER